MSRPTAAKGSFPYPYKTFAEWMYKPYPGAGYTDPRSGFVEVGVRNSNLVNPHPLRPSCRREAMSDWGLERK